MIVSTEIIEIPSGKRVGPEGCSASDCRDEVKAMCDVWVGGGHQCNALLCRDHARAIGDNLHACPNH